MEIVADPILEKWLKTVTKENTKKHMLVAMKKYLEYTKKTPRELIEEAGEDMKKSPLERRDIVKTQLIGFYNWLLSEADKHSPNGKGKQKVVGRGLSSMSALVYTSHIRSFYSCYDIVVRLKGASKIVGTPEHTRVVFTQSDVKRMYDVARTLRDKALVMFMFQSGCDCSTVSRLKYGGVMRGLESGEEPMMIETTRPKTSTRYFFFVGAEAIFALNNYLTELKTKGITIEADDPLFLKRNYGKLKKDMMSSAAVMVLFRDLALRSGIVKSTNGFNEAGSHAFRESFTSILHNSGRGIDANQIMFLSGHKIPSVAGTYLKQDALKLRQIYKENEHLLSIGLLSHPKITTDTDLAALRDELEKERRVSGELSKAVLELMGRIQALEDSKTDKEMERETDSDMEEYKKLKKSEG